MIEFYSTRGEFGFLSNFYRCSIYDDGMVWNSSEQLYQASKTTEHDLRVLINKTHNLYDVVKIGRSRGFPLRGDWEDIKVSVMYEILLKKFTQNPNLASKLLKTGDHDIVEKSPKDYFWGIGAEGTGKNVLGKLLVLVRKELNS